MKENYDVVVVGAGPAGIMACYELYLKQPELKVLLIDKGQDVMNRRCPIKEKKIKTCPMVNLGVYLLVQLLLVLEEQELILMGNLISPVNLVAG